MSTEPIVVEQTFAASKAEVWKAITEPTQMRKWFFEPMQQFEPEVGFETCFVVSFEGQDYPHRWNVQEVVPEERLVYRWRYDGFPGDSTVTWELFEVPEGTKLRLTHRGMETFPQDQPAFTRESCRGGWEYFVQESLRAFLG